jgi:aspartate racemase
MKILGLLGGMSWESSIEYERLINQAVRNQLGGTSSADLIIRSFNFSDIESLQSSGKWDEAGALLALAARNLEQAGAEAVILCTNTMHVLADYIQKEISIPFLHIADATGQAVADKGLKKVLLLGTKYTMEEDFYKGRLTDNFGLEVITPMETQRDEIHRVIYEELVRGIIKSSSRSYFMDVISEFTEQGVEGVIAGCTEIELLVKREDLSVAYFPTTSLHSAAAAEFALS